MNRFRLLLKIILNVSFVITIFIFIVRVVFSPSPEAISSPIEPVVRRKYPFDFVDTPTTPPTPQPRNATSVLLLGYMRGGSSLLGEFFNLNKDAFYWFEPLPALYDQRFTRERMRCRQLMCHMFHENGTYRTAPTEEAETMSSSLRNILSCNMMGVSMDIYTHYFMNNRAWNVKNHKMGGYYKCKAANGIVDCLDILEETCRSSPVRAIKVVRYRMDLVKNMIESMPNTNVKIIHLIRDPRGILQSRKYKTLDDDALLGIKLKGDNATREMLRFSEMLCQQIWRNIQEAEEINAEYPNRVLQIRYEQLATEPVRSLREIYHFLEQPVNPVLERGLWDKTHANKDGPKSGTKRVNATHTALRWRNMNATFQRLMMQQEQCDPLLEYFTEHFPSYL